MTQTLLTYGDWALLALQLVVGLIFILHGWPKLLNLRQTMASFTAMGFAPGELWGTVAALAESLGSIAIITGFFAQPFALVLAIQMTIATIWKMRRGQGLVNGYELGLLLVAALLTIATMPMIRLVLQ